MELHQVRYFLAVVETLNFTKAADQCNVTQPALTKAIQKLERELGGALIHRERQLTQLTDLGKTVLPMLKGTLAAAEAARTEAQKFQRKNIALLRVGLAPSISANIIAQPLRAIDHLFGGIHVEVFEEKMPILTDMLLAGDLSVAIAGDIPELPERIDCWRLFEERYVLLASRDHALAQSGMVSAELLRETVLLERIGCDAIGTLVQKFFAPRTYPPIRHRSARECHLQQMAAVGFGAILAPEHAPRLASLVAVPIEGNPVTRQIHMLAVAGRRYPPALDAFIKVTRAFDWRKALPPSLEPRGYIETIVHAAPEPEPVSL